MDELTGSGEYESSRLDSPGLERLLTTSEVGELLAVSRPTIYRLVRAGELRRVHVAARPRFLPADVRRYLEGRREGGDAYDETPTAA